MSTLGKLFCTSFPGSLLEEGRERTLRTRVEMFSVTRRKEKLFQAEKECVQHNLSFVGINVRSFGQQRTEISAVMQDINLLL